jgi:hypothetical protein
VSPVTAIATAGKAAGTFKIADEGKRRIKRR